MNNLFLAAGFMGTFYVNESDGFESFATEPFFL